MRVDEVMRKGDAVPLVRAGTSVADALIQTSRTKGRPGASIVVDEEGALAGIFTDGDLAAEGGDFSRLELPIDHVVAAEPRCCVDGSRWMPIVSCARTASTTRPSSTTSGGPWACSTSRTFEVGI